MKVSFVFPLFLAATQFLTPAIAAETPAAGGGDAAIIKRYDTNKDGQLDETEIAAVKEQKLMDRQQKRAGTRERVKERQQSWLKEFDNNSDGKLDPDEKRAMETTLRARAEKNPRLLKRLDTDGDGKLNDAEWVAAREKVIERLMK